MANARPFRDAVEPEGVGRSRIDEIAHDLRNPLGTILLGSTVLAADAGLSPRARKQVEAIVRAAERLERLVEELHLAAKSS